MRSIIRLVAAGALALPVIIGTAGLASADVDYDQNHLAATSEGSTVYDQAAGADDWGNSYAYEQYQAAGPYGAGSWLTVSATWDGHAFHYEHYTWSDPSGAYTGNVLATADAPSYGDHHNGYGDEADNNYGDEGDDYDDDPDYDDDYDYDDDHVDYSDDSAYDD